MRYGHRAKEYSDLIDMYCRTRAEGFGAEVKRRILVGTYVLSHGYYDAYYLQAQKVRRLIAQDFAAGLRAVRLDLRPDGADHRVRARREDRRPGADVPRRHLHHPGAARRPAGAVVPCGFDAKGLPVGLQLMGKHFSESLLLGVAHATSRPPTGTGACRAGDAAMKGWEIVVGIETHTQLLTKSKMFSGASTAFGAPPNTQASAVDLALPGTLPVLNRAAVEHAIRFGLAVNGTINRRSIFARKNYFYPDLPKGYQISQYETPIVQGGELARSARRSRCASRARTWRRTPASRCTKRSAA